MKSKGFLIFPSALSQLISSVRCKISFCYPELQGQKLHLQAAERGLCLYLQEKKLGRALAAVGDAASGVVDLSSLVRDFDILHRK